MLNNIIPIQLNFFQEYFETKINKYRESQQSYTFAINLLLGIGNSFFTNTGMIVFMLTIISFDIQDSNVSQFELFSLFATFGYLANSINSITFGGFMCFSQFKSFLVKVHKILKIKEKVGHRS